VKDGEDIIVDDHSGRTMQGRRWSTGLHRAAEAKAGVQLSLIQGCEATRKADVVCRVLIVKKYIRLRLSWSRGTLSIFRALLV
ncbi:hypothetical protein, partial [Escherichia coli]|uniref:preprotein translocase subunit SecA n=1 Tax=Escherichia coli TaxID=562 RepID=UPI00193A1F87